MTEGYTIEDHRGATAGIAVRQKGERGFRFVSASHTHDAMDGHVFVSAEAAQRAARELARTCVRPWLRATSPDRAVAA
jgi:hypothetical protein